MGFAPLALTDRCLGWVVGAVGPCSVGEALSGSTTATVVPVNTSTASYVLKWFTWAGFVAEDRQRVSHEAFGLDVARSAGVPAPTVVATDPDGSETGHPALLMTAVPGAPLPRPRDWPQLAADVALRLHDLDAVSPYRHLAYVPDPFVPRWASDDHLWNEAIATTRGLEASGEAIIHRDLHRWNMLWSGGDLTGVVDWLSVCRGPIGEDVARVWINEVLEGLPEQGAAFRDAYVAKASRRWDARWEVQAVLDMLPAYESDDAVQAWGNPTTRARLEDCLRIALGRR